MDFILENNIHLIKKFVKKNNEEETNLIFKVINEKNNKFSEVDEKKFEG